MLRALEYKYNEPFQTDDAPHAVLDRHRHLPTAQCDGIAGLLQAMTTYDDGKASTPLGAMMIGTCFPSVECYGYLAGTSSGTTLRYVSI